MIPCRTGLVQGGFVTKTTSPDIGLGVTLCARIVRQVVGADEDMAGALEMPNEMTFAAAWLDEFGSGRKAIEKRNRRRERRGVIVLRDSREFASPAHYAPSPGTGAFSRASSCAMRSSSSAM